MANDLVALTDRIDERLAALSLSDRKASMSAIGKPDLIRDIRRGSFPSADRLRRLAEVLETSVDYLLGKADVAPAADGRIVPALNEMPKDIPVYGTAIGADVEYVTIMDERIAVEQTDLSQSEVIDRFRRPPNLRERRDVYGLFVAGSSMEPAFESGRGILIDPKRPPTIRDYVVVYMRTRTSAEQDSDAATAVLIKRLIRRSGSFVELEQFNPAGVFRVDIKDVLKIERVMPWDEAFGL